MQLTLKKLLKLIKDVRKAGTLIIINLKDLELDGIITVIFTTIIFIKPQKK